MTGRAILRGILAAFYLIAGIVHLATPATFMPVMPDLVPYPREVILLTGVAELFGAVGLMIPRFRWWAGIGLAAYAVCVFPANIKHAWLDVAVAGDYATLWYHAPRMPLQPLLIWWALFCAGVINWPWRSQKQVKPARAGQP